MDDSIQKIHRGKVSASLLPAEAQFLAFVQPFAHSDATWKSIKTSKKKIKPVSVCSWKGVKCNAHQQAQEIQWAGFNLGGTLIWVDLPSTITHINLSRNDLKGELNLSCLPISLQRLYLNCNSLTGNLNLFELPSDIMTIELQGNQLSGEIKLDNMPQTLRKLNLSNNNFTGTVQVGHLLDSTLIVNLSQNSLDGIVPTTESYNIIRR